MSSIVISIGGSVFLSEEADQSFLVNLTKILKRYCKKWKIYIVIGGGKIARSYINRGREIGLDEKTLDEIGILITRINAKILTNLLVESNEEIPSSTEEAMKIDTPIVVMGGTTPGHSTDMVGAELAEKTQADRYIIATNVDGIYDKDPNRYADAKKFKEISVQTLIDKYGINWDSAGKNIVVDGPALGIIQRANLTTFVVNGKHLDQLEKAIANNEFNGTKIKV